MIMKAKLMVNDLELEVDISEEELKKLQKERKKKTGYERVDKGKDFYAVSGDDIIDDFYEEGGFASNSYYDTANYYSDETVAKHNARADKLMRQLRRFAVESRTLGLNWDNKDMVKWAIYYDKYEKKLVPVASCNARHYGTVYFDMALHAHQAIEKFHDELIWYFTKYKDSL